MEAARRDGNANDSHYYGKLVSTQGQKSAHAHLLRWINQLKRRREASGAWKGVAQISPRP
jgi:hypothetical protein